MWYRPDNLDKESIDVLQGFVIRLQGLDQLRRGIEEFLGQCYRTDLLKERAPFGEIRPVMRCTEKEDAVSGDVDGPQSLGMLVMPNALAVDEASLDHQASKGMGDEDDRSVGRFLQLRSVSVCASAILSHTYRSVGDQTTGQMFSMVVDPIFRRAICKSSHIRIVAVSQDSWSLIFERRR